VHIKIAEAVSYLEIISFNAALSLSPICLPTIILLILLMTCGLNAARRAQECSRKKELAYKNAVATYEAEHHAYAASESKAKRPHSLHDLVLPMASLM